MNIIKSTKTLFLIFLILIAAIILMSSCQDKNPSCNQLLSAIENCFDSPLPSCDAVYKMTASQFSREHLPVSLASLLYYGEKREELYELSLLSDYTIRLADKQCGSEIHILKVRASSDADTVEKLLLRRLDYMKTRSVYIYLPEDYQNQISNAAVFRVDNYLFLLSTPDNHKALDIAKDLID